MRRTLGEVAERSIAADCKSAAHVATEVRTLPSPPFDSALRASLMASRQGPSEWCPERAVGYERVEGLLDCLSRARGDRLSERIELGGSECRNGTHGQRTREGLP